MNFFKQLSETGIKDVTIEIKTAEDGRVTVVTIPKTLATDKALKSLASLTITATVEELDNGYFDAIKKPLTKTAEVFNNVEQYEQSLDSATKETAEAKSEKDKEKNAVADLDKLTAKLITPADWLKKQDLVKAEIEKVFAINPDNATAKKTKKSLEVNVGKAQLGDGLFADVPIEESVEEIPTAEIVEDEESETDEDTETE